MARQQAAAGLAGGRCCPALLEVADDLAERALGAAVVVVIIVGVLPAV